MPGPYVISGEVDAVVTAKDCAQAVPVEIKTRGFHLTLAVYPRERLQLQAYIQAMNAPYGIHVQNVLGSPTVTETVVARDDDDWHGRVVPSVEAFVCDVRRVVRNCAHDAELVNAVLDEEVRDAAAAATTPPCPRPRPKPHQTQRTTTPQQQRPPHGDRYHYHRRASASEPSRRDSRYGPAPVPVPAPSPVPVPVPVQAAAVVPAVATAVVQQSAVTLLHDMRVATKNVHATKHVFRLGQQVDLVPAGVKTVRIVTSGGLQVGCLPKTAAAHFAPLLQMGGSQRSRDDFKVAAEVIRCPTDDGGPLILSVTIRGAPRMLGVVGRFVSNLLKWAPGIPRMCECAAAAEPAPAPAPPAAAVTMAAAAVAAVSVETQTEPEQPLKPPVLVTKTSQKVTKKAVKRGRDAAIVDPVLQELVRRYGSVAGVPVMCTRSYRLRECKRRLV
jgi:hypothetical protein